MSFSAEEFTYNNVSCSEYGLMIYEMTDFQTEDTPFAGTVSIIEERIKSKYNPLFYGVEFDKKLELQIIFGLNMERIDAGIPMTRDEENDIATWLIGHDGYRYLTVDDDGLKNVRYKCIVTSLETITYGNRPWAMRAVFTCDGPYAYRNPEKHEFMINGSSTITIENPSCHHGYYRPLIRYSPQNGGDFLIVNQSDGGRITSITGIPTSVTNLTLDSDTLVLTNNADLNLYGCFNKKALRLKRGTNTLVVTGNGNLEIEIEAPVNVRG